MFTHLFIWLGTTATRRVATWTIPTRIIPNRTIAIQTIPTQIIATRIIPTRIIPTQKPFLVLGAPLGSQISFWIQIKNVVEHFLVKFQYPRSNRDCTAVHSIFAKVLLAKILFFCMACLNPWTATLIQMI